MKKRVVVTGMGAISPLGNDISTIWSNIKAGKCGIRQVTRFDTTDYSTKLAAEVFGFDPVTYINRKEVKRMDRFCQYALAASKLAVENSKMDLGKINTEKFGVIIGSGIGGIETFEKQYDILKEKSPRRVSPFFIPMMIPNMASGLVSIAFGAKGVCECTVSACSSGSNSIGNAFKNIQCGTMDVMICGGAEASITRMGFAGFCSMKATSTRFDPSRASIPFDKNRDGFVMGEGSGILILEEYTHAVNRGAKIYAELVGYGATSDAYHMTAPAPNGEGGARSMTAAINDAGLEPTQIDYINAHGTSTPLNDKNETAAIKTAFKDHAYKLNVSSTKSMTGHMLGAAGGIEGIICCLALKEGYIPATINYHEPDEDCDLNYTVNNGIIKEIDYALSNALGFGGHNSTLIFKKHL